MDAPLPGERPAGAPTRRCVEPKKLIEGLKQRTQGDTISCVRPAFNTQGRWLPYRGIRVANLFSVKDASTRRERHTRQEHRTGWRNLNSYSEFRVYSSQGQETQEANRLGQPYKVCYKPLPREQHLNSYPRLSTAITYLFQRYYSSKISHRQRSCTALHAKHIDLEVVLPGSEIV